MEDMARLALVEQNVRDADTFSKILYELLRLITHILENPQDTEIRTIRNEGLKKFFRYEALVDYLKSIGFQPIKNEYTYPKEHNLNNLRLAQAAIERKITFCCGSLKEIEERITKSLHKMPKVKENLMPVSYPTHNQLLKKMEGMFNSVLQYENEELQAMARGHIPLVTLQLMALDDMREHQRKIKTGEIKGQDMPYDIALLKVLLSWFKHRFFTWVDAPPCDRCGGDTRHYRNTQITTIYETCQLEIFECLQCGGSVEFPRYNSARSLLASRRGRCGEFANCFTMLCRALRYDARLVYSTSDHVWCEVWDYSSGTWIHCDPCECAMDSPLMYAHGWGRRLDYVFAFSRDDLQDVTWRYTTQHKEVVKRRTLCPESELIEGIMSMRAQRQQGVSEPRRKYLAKRCLQELATMLTERKPGESEMHGRISGAMAWRTQRGEFQPANTHVFRFDQPADCAVKYSAGTDKYEIENGERKEISSWVSGVYNAQHMFRKEEKDWKMAYLAREEGAPTGTVSWRVSAGGGCRFVAIRVRAHQATYEGASIYWTLQFDEHKPIDIDPTARTIEFICEFTTAELTARLTGGSGHLAWQHAQLFRAPLGDPTPALIIQATTRL
ncbi:transglutaminase-like superfamily domain-containing protein [Phthorimaea operculella]|nr:transglutaminase-like superfamily domain-containing protein [Phthorimaea operculella]